jgi:hypothetical protein
MTMPTTPSLFDDDPMAAPAGASLVRRPHAFGTSKKGKNVARLLAQLESLREAFAREKRRLDDALIVHAAQVRPRLDRVAALRTDVVRAIAGYLDARVLKKADVRLLKALLTEQVDEILAHVQTPPPDITALFERLHGVGFDEMVQESLDEARAEMADIFDELGLDMDVPDLRVDMTEEDMAASAARMAGRLRELHEAQAAQPCGRRKSKRELKAEAREAERERARKISLGGVYKRLVKALHPDREPDPVARERKSALMQQVTTAYAQHDFHTLLRLELECLDGEGSDAERRTDETLNAYAAVLREQIARLRDETMDLPLHPRYVELVQEGPYGLVRVVDVAAEVQRLDAVIEALTAGLERLSDPGQALQEVRDVLEDYRAARGMGPSRRPRRRR